MSSMSVSNTRSDPPEIDCIIKLGGSAITQKDQFETLLDKELRAAAMAIAQCQQHALKYIIVHGAGSFGHHQAKEYGINKGTSGLDDAQCAKVREGFCKTRISVTKLNHMVIKTLSEFGIPAVSVQACGSWQMDGGDVIHDGSTGVLSLLEAGLVPVLHGDCVIDRSQGCRILSGDTIIKVLCQRFNPKRVVFLTNVKGIFDKPPEVPGAKLLPNILVDEKRNLHVAIDTKTYDHDVTGGIQFKLNSATDIVQHHHGNIPVLICSLETPAFLNACLSGSFNGHPGTLLSYQDSTAQHSI